MQAPEEATQRELMLLEQMRADLKDLCLSDRELDTKHLLRFLRARCHSLGKSETMYRKHIEWRKTNDMDNVHEWQIAPECRSTHWPWYMPGFDRLGNPVIIVPVGIWDPSFAKQIGYAEMMRYSNHSRESVWCYMQRQSAKEKMIKQFTILIDIKGLSWRAVTTFEAMQGVLETLKCFEANYPETLHMGFLFNAPYAFNLAWKLVKPFLSEYTQRKLRFVSGSDPSSWRDQLTQVISPDQFWQKYGGDLPDYQEMKLDALFGVKATTTLERCADDVSDCCNNKESDDEDDSYS